MKRWLFTLALTSTLMNVSHASIVTHCPAAQDIKINQFGLQATTTYNGSTALFIGSEYDAESTISYFKEVDLVAENNLLSVNCVYVEKSGITFNLNPIKPAISSSGSVSG